MSTMEEDNNTNDSSDDNDSNDDMDDDTPTEDQNTMSESEDVRDDDDDDDDDDDEDDDDEDDDGDNDDDDDDDDDGEEDGDDDGDNDEKEEEEEEDKNEEEEEKEDAKEEEEESEETAQKITATLEPNPSIIGDTTGITTTTTTTTTRRATRNASSTYTSPTPTSRTSKKRAIASTSTIAPSRGGVSGRDGEASTAAVAAAAAAAAAASAASNASATAAAIAAAAAAAAMNGMTGIQSLLVGTPGALISSSSNTSSETPTTTTDKTTSTTTTTNTPSTTNIPGVPSPEQVRIAALKAVNECPPHVHLSSRDAAPQLKIQDGPVHRRLCLRGGMRGYRMARATHGVEVGIYYYECLILRPPGVREVVGVLPANVRLGKGLQKSMQEQLVREEFELRRKRSSGNEEQENVSSTITKSKKRKMEDKSAETNNIASTGPYANAPDTLNLTLPGHVRIGYSMRTGDLQAPVGYDRWSYGLRDIQGSRIHDSKREDKWGGESFGPGDVVGFAICLTGKKEEGGGGAATATTAAAGGEGGFMGLDASDGETSSNAGTGTSNTTATSSTAKKNSPTSTNHIRFFKNGEAMGHFIVSRGIRTGGEAFDNIQPGHYFPAVSAYMGGSVRVNFGPHFIYPPRRSLPSGMNKVKPISDLCKPPPTPDEAVASIMKERAFHHKKIDDAVVQAFKEAVKMEASIRYEAYCNHVRRHVEEVREGRMERGLSVADLPPPPPQRVGEEGDVDLKESGIAGGGGGEGIKT